MFVDEKTLIALHALYFKLHLINNFEPDVTTSNESSAALLTLFPRGGGGGPCMENQCVVGLSGGVVPVWCPIVGSLTVWWGGPCLVPQCMEGAVQLFGTHGMVGLYGIPVWCHTVWSLIVSWSAWLVGPCMVSHCMEPHCMMCLYGGLGVLYCAQLYAGESL